MFIYKNRDGITVTTDNPDGSPICMHVYFNTMSFFRQRYKMKDIKIMTTRKTGGLLHPYKGMLPASA